MAGGAIWGTIMVMLGYLAGASWKQVAHYATQVGIALFLVVVLALLLGHLLRSARDPDSWAGRQISRVGRSRLARWLERRFPAQLRWLAARFQSGVPTGFALTVAVLTLGACAWSLGSLTNSVLSHINSARLDPRVLAFVIGHRQPWLTGLAKTLTWLGSGFVLWPVVIGSGLALWWWRREWLPAVSAGAVARRSLGLVDAGQDPGRAAPAAGRGLAGHVPRLVLSLRACGPGSRGLGHARG